MIGEQQAQIFFDILWKLYRHREEQGVYQAVLEEAAKALHCEAGTLYLAYTQTQSLAPVASVGTPLSNLQNLQFRFGQGICGWVAQNCKSVILNDPKSDPRFTGNYDQSTGFATRSILCAPLPVREEALGVIELFNRKDRKFHPEDLFLLDLLGKHMAIALENAILYQHLSQLNAFNSGILNCLPGGFVGVDTEGTVTVCNQKAVEILRLESNDVIGKPVAEGFKNQPIFRSILDLAMKENVVLARQEVDLPFSPENIKIGYSTLLIRNTEGDLVGYGIIFQDITHLKK